MDINWLTGRPFIDAKRRSFLPPGWPMALALLFIIYSCQKNEKAFYPDGTPKYTISKNAKGKMEGESVWYYPDGKIQLKANYLDGVIHGKLIRYFENGAVHTEDEYENGRLNGLSKEWRNNGKIYVEMTYRNDTLNGISRQYDENEKVIIEGNYKNGLFEGKWLYRDRLGNLIGEADFKQGAGIKKSWDSHGALLGYTEYVDNLRHGKEVRYDYKEQVQRIRYYEYGEVVSDSIVRH